VCALREGYRSLSVAGIAAMGKAIWAHVLSGKENQPAPYGNGLIVMEPG
jgi:hypothetical protein